MSEKKKTVTIAEEDLQLILSELKEVKEELKTLKGGQPKESSAPVFHTVMNADRVRDQTEDILLRREQRQRTTSPRANKLINIATELAIHDYKKNPPKKEAGDNARADKLFRELVED